MFLVRMIFSFIPLLSKFNPLSVKEYVQGNVEQNYIKVPKYQFVCISRAAWTNAAEKADQFLSKANTFARLFTAIATIFHNIAKWPKLAMHTLMSCIL